MPSPFLGLHYGDVHSKVYSTMAASYSIHPPTVVLVDNILPGTNSLNAPLSPSTPADTSPLSSAPNSPIPSFDDDDEDGISETQDQREPVAFSIHNHHRFLSSTPQRRKDRVAALLEEKKSEDEEDDRFPAMRSKQKAAAKNNSASIKRAMVRSSWIQLQEIKKTVDMPRPEAMARSNSVPGPTVTPSPAPPLSRRTASLPFEDEMEDSSLNQVRLGAGDPQGGEVLTNCEERPSAVISGQASHVMYEGSSIDEEEDLPEDERRSSATVTPETSVVEENLYQAPTDEATQHPDYDKAIHVSDQNDDSYDGDASDDSAGSTFPEGATFLHSPLELLTGRASDRADRDQRWSVVKEQERALTEEDGPADEHITLNSSIEEEPADERRVDRRNSLVNDADHSEHSSQLTQSRSAGESSSSTKPSTNKTVFRPVPIDTDELGATKAFLQSVQQTLSNLDAESGDILNETEDTHLDESHGSQLVDGLSPELRYGEDIWIQRTQQHQRGNLFSRQSTVSAASERQDGQGVSSSTMVDASFGTLQKTHSPEGWSLHSELIKRRDADRHSHASSERETPKRDPEGAVRALAVTTSRQLPSGEVRRTPRNDTSVSVGGSRLDVTPTTDLDSASYSDRFRGTLETPISEPPAVRRINTSFEQDRSFESIVMHDDEPCLPPVEPPSLDQPPRSSASDQEHFLQSKLQLFSQQTSVVPDALEPESQSCLGGMLLAMESILPDQAAPTAIEAAPYSTKSKPSREATDPDAVANGLPASVYALNNDIGVPKGDTVLSLLNENVETTWTNRVGEAVWRGRTMRQGCNTRWLQEKLTRKPDAASRGRTSVQVDVDDARVVGGVHNLSNTQFAAVEHLKFDDLDDALALYEDVLTSYHNAFGDLQCAEGASEGDGRMETVRNYIGAALHNMGIIHLLRGEHEHAFAYFERAVMNRASGLGTGHPSYLASLVKLGICQISLEEFPKAQVSLEEALQSLIDQPESLADFRQLGEIFNNLGCLAHKRGERKKAVKYFRESIEAQYTASEFSLYDGSKFSSHSISLGITVTKANIGFLAMVSGETASSINTFENAVRELLLRDAHATLITTMDHLVVANLVAGRKDKAMRVLRRMLHMQIDAYGPNDTRSMLTGNKLSSLENEKEEQVDTTGPGKKGKMSVFRGLNPRRKKK